uniref:Uncharacterized protein n=1 Tax=Physcomitrium patens TaxID=3218 RepID=A0A2K1IS81_PHYPA|nr:hypothetical protein PHYPA_026265 [Physcomitrium patens]
MNTPDGAQNQTHSLISPVQSNPTQPNPERTPSLSQSLVLSFGSELRRKQTKPGSAN